MSRCLYIYIYDDIIYINVYIEYLLERPQRRVEAVPVREAHLCACVCLSVCLVGRLVESLCFCLFVHWVGLGWVGLVGRIIHVHP